jgi:hypothetical protein
MNKIKNYLLPAISFALLVGAFMFSGPLAGHSYGAPTAGDVKVVNTSSQPVPVAVTNTPTVKLASDPNYPTFVRDVDNPARQAFQDRLTFNLADGFSEVCMPIAVVPAGKRLVIEYVSARVSLPGGQKLRGVQLFNNLNGDFAYHYLMPAPTGAFNEYVVGQPLRLYADANTQVSICASRDLSAGTAQVLATISGYLVDMP